MTRTRWSVAALACAAGILFLAAGGCGGKDPGEKADISADSESLRKELAERFDAEIAAVRGVAQERTRVEMSPESIEQLKALGYLN